MDLRMGASLAAVMPAAEKAIRMVEAVAVNIECIPHPTDAQRFAAIVPLVQAHEQIEAYAAAAVAQGFPDLARQILGFRERLADLRSRITGD